MKPTPSFFQQTNKVVIKVATSFGLCKGHKRVHMQSWRFNERSFFALKEAPLQINLRNKLTISNYGLCLNENFVIIWTMYNLKIIIS
jgi:hypothetical protein